MNVETRKCRFCKEKFETTLPMQVYCCRDCSRKHQKTKRRVSQTLICKNCNREFMPYRNDQMFCSSECRHKYNREKRPNQSEPYNAYLKKRFEVLHRDNFTCQYCGRIPSDDGVKLEIDHIVPRIKGGTDETANLITSCSECNLGKGDILLQERENARKLKKSCESHLGTATAQF